MRVEAVEIDSPRLADVLQLHRAHTNTLGFMPAGAFRACAERGTLLVAIGPGGATAGYAFYDLPRREIALRHLCVAPDYLGQGVARRLVDEIEARHSDRLGIVLRCRNDYPAAKMWPRLDFEPLIERRGRSLAGYPLTVWWRDFGHPTLLTPVEHSGDRPRVALDTDVFLDLSLGGERAEASAYLAADWLQDLVELVVTKEIAIEVNNSDDADLRDRHRRFQGRFPRCDTTRDVWQPIEARLRDAITTGRAIGEHDERDIRHVARAAAGGAQYFVTRDDRLVSRLGPLAIEHGIEVLTPAELIARVSFDANPYAPVQLEHTRFQLCAASQVPIDELARRFLNTATGERIRDLRRRLSEAYADSNAEAYVITDADEQTVAMIARTTGGHAVEVLLLRVAGPMASTISRHVSYLQRHDALTLGKPIVRVTDRHLSAPLPEALTAEGFTPVDHVWVAAPRAGCLLASQVPRALSGPGGALDLVPAEVRRDLQRGRVAPSIADDLERRHSPLRVIGVGVRTYLVPIKPGWAASLFDKGLSEQTLFPRADALGMSREHVYYSGSHNKPRLPARILWYVSGHRCVRAVSRVDEAVVDRPRTLHRRYQHLGVWELRDVAQAATRGKAMALRFSDTELLPVPVPLAELKDMATGFCHTLFLQSIHEVPEQLFVAVYERGTHGFH